VMRIGPRQRAATYIVISKPKRKSWACGVCQIMFISWVVGPNVREEMLGSPGGPG
jgi:hypothetical protein